MSNKERIKQLQKIAKRFSTDEKRESLSKKEWDDLHLHSTKSGTLRPSKKEKKEISLFSKKQKDMVHKPYNISKVPKWVYALIESGKSQEEVFNYVLKRAKRAPGRQSLQLLEHIINDAGRKGNAPGFVKKMVPQDLVSEFIKLTNPKTK